MRYLFLVITINFFQISYSDRSPHRPIDKHIPTIHARYINDARTYTIKNSHLEEVIIKLFDKDYFFDHLLPPDNIYFRYDPSQNVLGSTLTALIEELLVEIENLPRKQKKICFKHFTIIKNKNTETRDHTGLYVLRFNDYPFILKLFIETPKSFVDPLAKGLEPNCFFYMAGGVGRHILGFTRVQNLEIVQRLIKADPYWSCRVDFPRKWFWLPKDPHWIQLSGKNIGPQKTIRAVIPGVYGIVCDEIIWHRPFNLKNYHERILAMSLCNFLQHRVDSHIDNFGIEASTGLIVPIDFERFPDAVGFKRRYFCGYFDWYSHLSWKMFSDMMLRDKYERHRAQYAPYTTW